MMDGVPQGLPQFPDSRSMGPGHSGQSGQSPIGPGNTNQGPHDNLLRPFELRGPSGSGAANGGSFQPGHTNPSQTPGASPGDGIVY